jgi:hypothetical protein
MTDLVHLFIDRNFDKKRQKGLAGHSNPLELLTALAANGYAKGNKDGQLPEDSLIKIATIKKSGSKPGFMQPNPLTGNRDIPYPKGTVFGGTAHQRGDFSAHANKNHEIDPQSILHVLESFIASRFPGNDGVDIPSWHLENISELWLNGRKNQKETKLKKKGVVTSITTEILGEALIGQPLEHYNNKKYREQESIWSPPEDSDQYGQLPPIRENPKKAAWIVVYDVNRQHNRQSQESPEAGSSKWGEVKKQQRAFDRFEGASTIVHEMSHQLWNSKNCPTWMRATVIKEYLRALDADKGFPSDYSKHANVHEFFAECYTGYVMHTKAFRERNETMATLMDHFFKDKPPESRDLTDEEAEIIRDAGIKSDGGRLGEWQNKFREWKQKNDWGKLSISEHRITKEDDEEESLADEEESLAEVIQDTEWLGKFNPAGKNLPAVDDEETDVSKSWMTNPRGSENSYREDHDDTGYKKVKTLKKEGDGGGDGGFGDGGGTVFTSANAGIFTPTYSDRSTRRKRKNKDKSGIERIGDFITDNSPERKMEKAVVELVKWVTIELRKDANKHFRQQTSGETINSQPPRLDWKKGNREITETTNNPSEFEGHPDKQAAISQNNTTRRIKQLDDEDESDRPKDTGSASVAAPAGVNIKLAWESGGIEADELHRGGDKDKLQGHVIDSKDSSKGDDFIEELFKEIEKELDNL